MKPTNILEPYDLQFLEMVRSIKRSSTTNENGDRYSQPFEIIGIHMQDEFPLLKAVPLNTAYIADDTLRMVSECYDTISDALQILESSIYAKVSIIFSSADNCEDLLIIERDRETLNAIVILPGDVLELPRQIATYGAVFKLISFHLGLVCDGFVCNIISPYIPHQHDGIITGMYENMQTIENLSYLNDSFRKKLKETDPSFGPSVDAVDTYPRLTINADFGTSIFELTPDQLLFENYHCVPIVVTIQSE